MIAPVTLSFPYKGGVISFVLYPKHRRSVFVQRPIASYTTMSLPVVVNVSIPNSILVVRQGTKSSKLMYLTQTKTKRTFGFPGFGNISPYPFVCLGKNRLPRGTGPAKLTECINTFWHTVFNNARFAPSAASTFSADGQSLRYFINTAGVASFQSVYKENEETILAEIEKTFHPKKTKSKKRKKT